MSSQKSVTTQLCFSLFKSEQFDFQFIRAGVRHTGRCGIFSHPAIITSDYRVPAVVATGNATSLLEDGQIVTVNGAIGTVEILL